MSGNGTFQSKKATVKEDLIMLSTKPALLDCIQIDNPSWFRYDDSGHAVSRVNRVQVVRLPDKGTSHSIVSYNLQMSVDLSGQLKI